MNVYEYISAPEDEKPLDRIVTDGGFCGIFRTIGCIGDSLSSGEFESRDAEGKTGYHDMFEYSWGQYIARSAGCTVRNFSRGGMTASEYCCSFGAENGYWDEDKLCQAYIMALGVNDVLNCRQPVGSLADICDEDYTKNAETFAGYYAQIIQRLRKMQPYSRFFLMTMPRQTPDDEPLRGEHAALLYDLAEHFGNAYVLDFYRYAPVYDAEFRRRFYLGGHLNPAGYLLTARMTESYIDYIVRHNPGDFKQIGFIGTPYCNLREKR